MVTTIRGGNLQRLQPTAAFDEHPQVRATLTELAERAQNGGASSILFLPQKGVQFDAYAFAYHTNHAKEMNITRASGPKLVGTLAINISGHATGGIQDRVVGWAEREFARQGVRVGDDAKRFLALRAACNTASGDLQRDYQRSKSSVDIAFEGKTVTLRRDVYDKMQRASYDSDDDELSRFAELGNQALRKLFGAENTYNVRVRTADGQTTEVRGIARNNPDKIEYATRIPLEIPLLEGETILEAWPTGSAEVAGYVEARRYKIHYKKDLFDLAKADAAAAKYEAAYPQVRWNTDHESDDLETHHVNPSPRPYQDF